MWVPIRRRLPGPEVRATGCQVTAHRGPLNELHRVVLLPGDFAALEDSDDILQEVYLDVARQISQFENRGPGSFLKWVQAILDHKLTDAWRAAHCQARDINREVAIHGAGTDSHWDLLDILFVDSATPSREMRRKEALDAMLASLSGLTESHRQVIQLRYLEGLSVAEVAGRLGKTDAAVVALTKRALNVLCESMNRLGDFTRGA